MLALPRIHLLFFANMTAVMEEMSMDKEEESFGPFFLEHFDNSDYGWGVTVRGEGVRHTLTTPRDYKPKIDPTRSPWMDGLTSFANISSTFPHISSCRLVASDREVGHLNDLPNLRQLEVDKYTITFNNMV